MVCVEFGGDRIVVSSVDEHRDIVVIFCRCADQRGSADVDIFYRVRKPGVRCRHSFLEWIEIHDHHVDGLDIMLTHLALMILVCAPREDSAVNLRMQRLDATVEHLGQAGKILDGLTFTPAFSRAAAVPPVDTISTPCRSRAVAKAARPALSETPSSARLITTL